MQRWHTLAMALVGAILFAGPCLAIEQAGVSDTTTTTALSTASGGCLAANGFRRALTLDNSGGTINIGYCETAPATPSTPCTAAIGTAGTTTLSAGSVHYWRAGSAPQNQFCFISASGTPSITIREGY